MNPHEQSQETMTRTYSDGLIEVSRLTDNSEGNSETTTFTFKSLGSSDCFELASISDSEVSLTIVGAWEIGGIVAGLKRILV